MWPERGGTEKEEAVDYNGSSVRRNKNDMTRRSKRYVVGVRFDEGRVCLGTAL